MLNLTFINKKRRSLLSTFLVVGETTKNAPELFFGFLGDCPRPRAPDKKGVFFCRAPAIWVSTYTHARPNKCGGHFAPRQRFWCPFTPTRARKIYRALFCTCFCFHSLRGTFLLLLALCFCFFTADAFLKHFFWLWPNEKRFSFGTLILSCRTVMKRE